jgi:hypothetical protein
MQENLFSVFSIASTVKKILANKIKLLYSIFSQKLCIGIALIDTFLSIAAHLCSPGGKGVGINIFEDARHWIGLLQYNPSMP